MKKKEKISSNDRIVWERYAKEMKDVFDKDMLVKRNPKKKIKVVDLHGYSLDDANEAIRKIILDSGGNNYSKIKVITGKGIRSRVKENPYLSSELSILKNSIPEYIKNQNDLLQKIKKIDKASYKDGGEGAFYIELK